MYEVYKLRLPPEILETYDSASKFFGVTCSSLIRLALSAFWNDNFSEELRLLVGCSADDLPLDFRTNQPKGGAAVFAGLVDAYSMGALADFASEESGSKSAKQKKLKPKPSISKDARKSESDGSAGSGGGCGGGLGLCGARGGGAPAVEFVDGLSRAGTQYRSSFKSARVSAPAGAKPAACAVSEAASEKPKASSKSNSNPEPKSKSKPEPKSKPRTKPRR